MSDFEDDYDDDYDFEFAEYFYVEDTYDMVGDLAEHSVPSPPPCEDGDWDEDWDRFAYWNDVEYDSDGYHDIDTERIAHNKKRRVQPSPKGRLKRGLDHIDNGPAKRRKGKDGAIHTLISTLPEIMVTPVGWKENDDQPHTPVRKGHEEPFALLKDWRVKFPDAEHSQNTAERDEIEDEESEHIEIDRDAILAALHANLGKLTGGASGEDGFGADEELLMQHITQMISKEGVSVDDIAGGLADALFAPDDESVTSEVLQEKKGDGQFGQLILKQAEAQAGPGASQEHNGQPSPPADAVPPAPATASDKVGKSLQTPSQPKSAERQPPTPPSTESSGASSQKTAKPAVDKVQEPAKPKSRKRKADSGFEESEPAAPAKRSATRSFDAPTASSKSKTTQVAEKPVSKMAARKASKAKK